MHSRSFIPVFGLCLAFGSPLYAQPVHVSITQPETAMTTVLAALAKESGAVILSDSTVTTPVGVADLHADSVPAMLDDLKSLDPAMSWQEVDLPATAPVPSADVLEQEVSALKSVQTSGLVLPDAGSIVSYTRTKAAPNAPLSAGTQVIYLVTEKPQASSGQDAGASVSQITAGLSQVADQFGQLSAADQSQALPLMFQQFQRIIQLMDPSVRSQLPQWMQGGRGGQ
jgi:hypothetical protein